MELNLKKVGKKEKMKNIENNNIENDFKNFINEMSKRYEIFPYLNIENDKNNYLKVPYSSPYWDNTEIIAIMKSIFFGKWLASGEDVKKFEKKFAQKINEKYGLMVNSGSSANLLMISAIKKILSWNNQDEIIVSPVAFPTTISVIPQNNLVPVFVDI